MRLRAAEMLPWMRSRVAEALARMWWMVFLIFFIVELIMIVTIGCVGVDGVDNRKLEMDGVAASVTRRWLGAALVVA
jgi:hypothetical protein